MADRHVCYGHNYPNEVKSSGTKTKLTSEENLLVGVEGVDDEGEELVDISRRAATRALRSFTIPGASSG